MRIAGWILGVLVIFLAVSILRAEQMIAGAIFLVAGVIALPPFWDQVNKRREADGKSPISEGFSLIPAGCILIFSCIVLVNIISDPKVSVQHVQRGLNLQTFDHRFNNYMAEEGTQIGVALRSNLAGGEVTKGNNGNSFSIKDNSISNQGMVSRAIMSPEGILTEVFMVKTVEAAKGSSAVAFSVLASTVALSGIIEAFDSTITEEERREIVGLLTIRGDFCGDESPEFIRSGVKYYSSCIPDLGIIIVGAAFVE
ncbi:MAG: hypothetical protein OXU78_08960 [Deltaproteobacteria bacterium]|nr:hypothetical protein [Deltaproteobacteria bacterium]